MTFETVSVRWTLTPSLTLPRKGDEDKSLPPLREKVRMGGAFRFTHFKSSFI